MRSAAFGCKFFGHIEAFYEEHYLRRNSCAGFVAMIALVAAAGARFRYAMAGRSRKGDGAANAVQLKTVEKVSTLAKVEAGAMWTAKKPELFLDTLFNGPDSKPKTL